MGLGQSEIIYINGVKSLGHIEDVHFALIVLVSVQLKYSKKVKKVFESQ